LAKDFLPRRYCKCPKKSRLVPGSDARDSKNQGYNFAHNYGHGEDNLSVVFAMLMMLAFLVDQTQQLGCALFQAVWTKLGSKRRLWERMRALFYDYAFASMRQLFEALLYGFKKSSPLVAVDSS
jgi:hypothetical protein